MKLSTKGKYGIYAMIDIAVYAKDKYVPLNAVAKRQEIPELYLEQIMASLKKNDLVKSARGAYGGYKLAKDAKDININEIVIALEGSYAPVDCLDDERDKEHYCETACQKCVTRKVWDKVFNAINDVLDDITLNEISEDYIETYNIVI